ncbi:helix-turn-helix domain-containing protein [Nguyenibacter vanlangensis]|uniref:Helix-turn-helix domain-containing protein n=1 Tax=Nguyenibacter vanlangensis TaxID=1216886 RepID=A0ABZ3D1M9_9PROT
MEFLTIDDLVSRWRDSVSRRTLGNWRAQGKGPPYRKIGQSVLYRLSDVIAFENGENGTTNDQRN